MMTWYMMRFWALVADKYLLCSHMDELDIVWFRSCRVCCYSWDLLPTYVTSCHILKIMVILDHMNDCLTHIWRCCSGMIISFWKECFDAAKDLKAWLLIGLCYNHWMTLEDTTTLFYLSVVQGSIQISQKEAEHCIFRTEDQIWLKYRRWYWIRGFPETQSRIYASSCTKNRVCLIADNFLFGVSFLHHSCSVVWYLWYCLVSLVVFQFS